MSNVRQCPTTDQLRQLASGELQDPPASDIESHVLECAACQEATESFKIEDTFVGQVRDAVKVEAAAAGWNADDRARVERVIGQASGIRNQRSEARDQKSEETGLPGETTGSQVGQRDFVAELARSWQSPQQPGEIGRLGPYRVLKLLGKGGMGAVLLAEDEQLQRLVALKVIRPHAAAATGAAERFLREARAAAAVRHDNVVTIYQVGQDNGVPFIAQELLHGESLEERLARDQKIPVEEAIAIARQIAAGLAAAHARGLLHRDIKPANVWLEDRSPHVPPEESILQSEMPAPGRVKLLDFGLARSLADDTAALTQSGVIVGTPAYMAPEQAANDAIDARADLFSLGVVLYRMLTGVSPFHKTSTMASLKALALENPLPPLSLNDQIPAQLSALVMQLLSKNPADRPVSALEVVKALANIAPSTPLPVSPSQPVPARPLVIALALGSLAALILAGVIVIIRNKEGREIARVQVPDDGSVEVQVKDIASPGPSSIKPERAVESARPSRGAAPPRTIPKTDPLSPHSLVTRPAPLPGIKRWSLETIAARGNSHLGSRPISLDPAGKNVAFADGSSSVRIFDTATQSVARVVVFPDRVWSIDWSPDGKLLGALGPDHLWIAESSTGRVIQSRPGAFGIYTASLQWSADSQWLAATCGRELWLWERPRNEYLIRRDLGDRPRFVAWSPTAPRLAVVGEDQGIRVFDPVAKSVERTFSGHTNVPCGVTWSPDGTRLASCAPAPENTLRVWDFHSENESLTVPSPANITSGPVWSPDGKWLACAGGTNMVYTYLLDVEVRRFEPPLVGFYQCGLKYQCWSPDSRTLYRVPSFYQEPGSIAVDAVELESRKRVAQWPGFTAERVLEGLSPDSSRLLMVFKRVLNGADLSTGAGKTRQHWGTAAASWSGNGKFVAVPTYEMSSAGDVLGPMTAIFDRSLERVSAIPTKTGEWVSLSPDGRSAAIYAVDKALRIWDIAKGQNVATFPAGPSAVWQARWSPSGNYIATWHYNDALMLWNTNETESPRWTTVPKDRPALDWSSSGEQLVVVNGKEVRVVDPEKREVVLAVTAPQSIKAADDDPGIGLTFVTADGTLSLKPRESLGSHTVGMTQACDVARFLLGGKLLATNREQDPAIFLWDTRTAEPRGVIVPFASEHHVAISPDGHYRGTAGIDKQLVYIVQTDGGEQVTLTPDEFATKYSWQNDPAKVPLP